MRAARRFILSVFLAAFFLGTGVPVQAETLSVTYSAHRAYRGTDDGFFAGLVLSGQNLFSVDLGAVVSKYVGETEKNLDAVFESLGTGDIVLFFDEATAALDNVTEREITAAITRLSGQKTVICVAHRLSTIRGSDTIHLIEGGRVSASGTYDDVTNVLTIAIVQTVPSVTLVNNAHIHQAPPGVPGGVVIPLPGPFNVSTSYNLASTNFNLTGAQETNFLAGLYYVNIHTVALPAGEIRGQLNPVAVPGPGALPLLALGGGLLALRRRC